VSQPPTGAVTFLFTDIQGSTRLVKQLRDGYSAVLAKHQRLLRDAFSAHGGYEVDTQGDSFFVAFASARNALLAAVEGQLALAAQQWPDGVEIKVRMGLHTGQAVASDGRYTGLAVHRAARIGAAGHGGQILVSQATQTLLEDEEEDLHIFLTDLGEQRLKDLDRPVRLYQAAADGLRTEFPPVRGLEPADAGDAAVEPVPFWRRRAALGIAVAVLVLALAGAYVATRDATGGLSAVSPNHVGIIDPASNEIVAEIPVGIEPGPIAAGAGAVWVGNRQDRTLSKIDPAERSATATISLENRTPTGLAVGLGSVWVAHGLRGQLSRVEPQFGQVAQTTAVASTAFGSPNGSVTLDADTAWAVFGDSTLVRLNASGKVLGQTLAREQPAGIVVAGGSVWVTNSGDATVQRFNPQTFEEGPIRTFNVGAGPSGIVSTDNAIWVANSADDEVTRIAPDSAATRSIPVGDGPSALAATADAVWVANTAAGTVSRIDIATNEVVATIEIGNPPIGLAVSDGVLWVTVQAP
jgi:YVTN family beta-propeller protein